jgi:phosphatidylserine/phosphatidylglycerophosphate/cardiolipin synthase-like enzyme
VLAAAVAVSISAPIAASLRAGFADLRAELVNLMAATQEELILASPFWDAETVDDLGELLARRLDAGVKVKILCRGLRSDASGDALRALSKRLRSSSGLEIFEWFSLDADDALGSSTFHAKVAVADGGTRAYVGSANFTISGLRSRYEVGVFLEGMQAQRIGEAMATILNSVAQRCESLSSKQAGHPWPQRS